MSDHLHFNCTVLADSIPEGDIVRNHNSKTFHLSYRYLPFHEPSTSTAKQLHHFPSKMASTSIGATGAPANAPGEQHEVRQTTTTEDMKPNPSQSLPLSSARQALVDDIIALYSCEPTIKRVERYTPDCVYDDQFVYANDRYKMAGQWFALPKLFKESRNEGYEVIKNEDNCELLFSWIDIFTLLRRERERKRS